MPRNFSDTRASVTAMLLTRRHLFGVLLPAYAAIAVPDYDADELPKKKVPLFESLFPVPSGTNGFEEIIRAGERLEEVKAPHLSRPVFTLAKRRTYLADPACRDALSLLRDGMEKPIRIPTPDPAAIDSPTPFAAVRVVARLLSTEMHVCYADGRDNDAFDIFARALVLTHAMRSINVIGGIVGGGMDASLMIPFLEQRDRWNLRDCARIEQLTRNWLEVPDPAVTALSWEREFALRGVAGYREKWNELAEQLEDYYATYEDEPDTPLSLRAEEYAEALRTDPAVRERVLGEMAGMINAHFDRAYALMRAPTGLMRLDLSPGVGANWHPITRLLRPVMLLDAGMISQRAVQDRLRLQLLCVHAAIRRYRWEYDRLPKTLSDLELPPRLVIDPFTAKPLLYEPEATGTRYKLASAGALVPGEDGKPDARERFSLTRDP